MKRSALALCLWLFACACAHAAERISIEVGRGIHNLRGAEAAFVRYAGDTPDSILFGQNFYEFSFGAWDGRDRSSAVGAALGTRVRENRIHLDASIGLAYLENKTRLSGTHQQFIVRLGGGIAFGRLDVSLFVTHYSNAKPVFDWDGPNAGYDFVTLQFGYPLR
jgi:hypothetical protein